MRDKPERRAKNRAESRYSLTNENPFAAVLRNKKTWQCLNRIYRRFKLEYWQKFNRALYCLNPQVFRFVRYRMKRVKNAVISRLKEAARISVLRFDADYRHFRRSIFRACHRSILKLKKGKGFAKNLVYSLNKIAKLRLKAVFGVLRLKPLELEEKSKNCALSKVY